MLNINLEKRQIEIQNNCEEEEVVSFLKNIWLKDVKYCSYPFPMKKEEDGTFSFINNWRHSSVDSYSRTKIKMERPARPLCPIAISPHKTFEDVKFDEPVQFSEVLRHVPSDVPANQVRLIGGDGYVTLSIPGSWPKAKKEFEREQDQHILDVKQWEKDVMKYEEDLKFWKHLDAWR